ERDDDELGPVHAQQLAIVAEGARGRTARCEPFLRLLERLPRGVAERHRVDAVRVAQRAHEEAEVRSARLRDHSHAHGAGAGGGGDARCQRPRAGATGALEEASPLHSYTFSGTAKGFRYSRVRSRFAPSSPTTRSVFGSKRSSRPSRYEMLARWQSPAERWPSVISALSISGLPARRAVTKFV